MSAKGFLYLASPYSHADFAVREARYIAACRVTARLMRDGELVFSPIAHSHPVALHGCLDAMSQEFWLWQDFGILRHAAKLVVLMIAGWRESKGIRAEIEFANENAIPVSYMLP